MVDFKTRNTTLESHTKHRFLSMERHFFFCIFFLIFQLAAGQSQVPVFRLKEDSIKFEKLQLQLAEAFKDRTNRKLLDSLITLQRKMLEKGVIRFRTIYRPSSTFTRYTDLAKLENLKNVTRLTIADYNGKQLPDSIFLCDNLTELEFVNTRIEKISGRASRLSHLRKITLLNNRPSKRLRLSSNVTVETLVIHGDELGRLPTAFRRFKNLRMLNLAQNNLTSFPSVKNCKLLTELILNNNKLTLESLSTRQSISLEELELQFNLIKKVPDAIGSFSGLKKLLLTANQVEEIGTGIAKLQRLEVLSLYRNKLPAIPPALYQLKKLREIDLYYNQIQKLDSRLPEWSNLEILYLANNQLFTLPDNLGSLKRLRELYLHHNRLSSIPSSVGQLDSLKVLRVNHNMLLEIPSTLYNLAAMENLDISSNYIRELNTTIFKYPKLKLITLGPNPWEDSFLAQLPQWAEKLRSRGAIVNLAMPGIETEHK